MRMIIKMMMRRGVTKIIALYWHPRYLYSGSNPSKRDNQGLHCVSHKPKKLSDRNELKLALVDQGKDLSWIRSEGK